MPRTEQEVLQKASEYFANQKYFEALHEYEALFELNPYPLAGSHVSDNNLLKTCQECAKVQGKDVIDFINDNNLKLSPAYKHLIIAGIHYRSGSWQKAISEYQATITILDEQNLTTGNPWHNKCVAWQYTGHSYARWCEPKGVDIEERIQKAKEAFQKAITHASSSNHSAGVLYHAANSYLIIAMTLKAINKIEAANGIAEEARVFAEEAIALDEINVYIPYPLATYRAFKGNPEEQFIELYILSLKRAKDNNDAQLNVCQFFGDQYRIYYGKSALDLWLKTVFLHPDCPPAIFLNIVKFYMAQENYVKATIYAQRYFDKYPTGENILDQIELKFQTLKSEMHQQKNKTQMLVAQLEKSDDKLKRALTEPNHLLLESTKLNNLKLVEAALDNNVDINFADEEGLTALHWAAKGGCQAVLESLLLKPQINIDVTNKNGETPLHLACMNGHQIIVDLLIKQHLIKLGAKLKQPGKDISQDNNSSQNQETPTAAIQQFMQVIEKAPAQQMKQYVLNSILFWATKQNVEPIVKQAIAQGANVNVRINNQTPLHLATSIEELELVKLLIKSGADVEAEDGNKRTPLEILIHIKPENKNGFAVRSILLDQKLICAVRQNDIKTVFVALSEGANLQTATDQESSTSLHIAAGNGNFDLVQKLLERGAPIEVKNNKGQIPLHVAILCENKKGAESVVKFLAAKHGEQDGRKSKEERQQAKQQGYSIYTKDNFGKTPYALIQDIKSDTLIHKFLKAYEIAKNEAKKTITTSIQQFGIVNNFATHNGVQQKNNDSNKTDNNSKLDADHSEFSK